MYIEIYQVLFVYRNPNHNKVQGTRGKMRSSTVSTKFLGAFRFMADLDASGSSVGEASAEPGPWCHGPQGTPHVAQLEPKGDRNGWFGK